MANSRISPSLETPEAFSAAYREILGAAIKPPEKILDHYSSSSSDKELQMAIRAGDLATVIAYHSEHPLHHWQDRHNAHESYVAQAFKYNQPEIAIYFHDIHFQQSLADDPIIKAPAWAKDVDGAFVKAALQYGFYAEAQAVVKDKTGLFLGATEYQEYARAIEAWSNTGLTPPSALLKNEYITSENVSPEVFRGVQKAMHEVNSTDFSASAESAYRCAVLFENLDQVAEFARKWNKSLDNNSLPLLKNKTYAKEWGQFLLEFGPEKTFPLIVDHPVAPVRAEDGQGWSYAATRDAVAPFKYTGGELSPTLAIMCLANGVDQSKFENAAYFLKLKKDKNIDTALPEVEIAGDALGLPGKALKRLNPLDPRGLGCTDYFKEDAEMGKKASVSDFLNPRAGVYVITDADDKSMKKIYGWAHARLEDGNAVVVDHLRATDPSGTVTPRHMQELLKTFASLAQAEKVEAVKDLRIARVEDPLPPVDDKKPDAKITIVERVAKNMAFARLLRFVTALYMIATGKKKAYHLAKGHAAATEQEKNYEKGVELLGEVRKRFPNLEKAHYLITEGADMSVREKDTENTSLMYISARGHEQLLDLALEKTEDAEAVNAKGQNAARLARNLIIAGRIEDVVQARRDLQQSLFDEPVSGSRISSLPPSKDAFDRAGGKKLRVETGSAPAGEPEVSETAAPGQTVKNIM